jgi:hypothetical protein
MLVLSAVAVMAPSAAAQRGTGGAAFVERARTAAPAPDTEAAPTARPARAMLIGGRARAPHGAPAEVKRAIAAANEIVGKPYKYGGGHARIVDSGYDCSGTVSFALNGAGLLKTPLDSGSFMSWGEAGKGRWITVYTNPGHAYTVIAGLRLDTSAAGDPSGAKGPRWRPALRSSRGFVARHPEGL